MRRTEWSFGKQSQPIRMARTSENYTVFDNADSHLKQLISSISWKFYSELMFIGWRDNRVAMFSFC